MQANRGPGTTLFLDCSCYIPSLLLHMGRKEGEGGRDEDVERSGEIRGWEERYRRRQKVLYTLTLLTGKSRRLHLHLLPKTKLFMPGKLGCQQATLKECRYSVHNMHATVQGCFRHIFHKKLQFSALASV